MRIENVSISRKCFNVMMTLAEYAALKEVLFGPRRGDSIDYHIALSKRILMVVFWIVDLICLFYRMRIFKGSHAHLSRLQSNLYLINSFLNMLAQIRHFHSGTHIVQRSMEKLAGKRDSDAELLRGRRKRAEAVVGLAKLACDLPGAFDGSGVWRWVFGTSINEAVISIGSVVSASISLRALLSAE